MLAFAGGAGKAAWRMTQNMPLTSQTSRECGAGWEVKACRALTGSFSGEGRSPDGRDAEKLSREHASNVEKDFLFFKGLWYFSRGNAEVMNESRIKAGACKDWSPHS